MVIAKTASRNVAFKSDKLMDALFREGQSGPQTPQTAFVKKEPNVDFPRTSTDKWQYLAKEVSDCDEKGCGDLRIPWGVRIWKWKRLIFCLTN